MNPPIYLSIYIFIYRNVCFVVDEDISANGKIHETNNHLLNA